MHLDTIYGSHRRYVVKEEKVNASFTADKISRVSKPAYRIALLKRLEAFGNDPKKAFTLKNSLDKNPVYLDEKQIEKVKKPAALICATDRIAQGAYKVFYEKNIAIPEEVSVVGFGDYETGELMRPPLTTVKFDWKNWGESSAETMLQMIQEKPVSQIQVNPYEFIERESVR